MNRLEWGGFRAYSSFFARRRGIISGGVVLLTVLSAIGLTRLKFDEEPSNLFRSSGSDFQRLEDFYRSFGPDDNELIFLIERENLFTGEVSTALSNLVGYAESLPAIERVISLSPPDLPSPPKPYHFPRAGASVDQFIEAEKAARKHPLTAGRLIDRSGQAMIVAVVIKEKAAGELSGMISIVDDLRSRARKEFSAVRAEVSLAGHIAIQIDSIVTARYEFFSIMGVAAVLGTLIAMLLFRRFRPTAAAFGTSALAVVWTVGTLGWMGWLIDGIGTSVPMLIFVLGFASSVHILVEVRQEEKDGVTSLDAAVRAIRHLGPPCALAALTTAIGFGSLLLARTDSVQNFGIACSLGVGLGLLANLTFLPLVVSFGKSSSGKIGKHPSSRRSETISPALRKTVFFASPVIVLLGILFASLLIRDSLRLRSDIVWTEMLPSGSETVRAMHRCDELFDGAMRAYALVSWEEDNAVSIGEVMSILEEIHASFRDHPVLGDGFSLINL
ncbi:MAG: MMPL family transporter, partial [Verrucomicrobiota bacterium]